MKRTTIKQLEVGVLYKVVACADDGNPNVWAELWKQVHSNISNDGLLYVGDMFLCTEVIKTYRCHICQVLTTTGLFYVYLPSNADGGLRDDCTLEKLT